VETRRLGRTGQHSTVLIFGGAALGGSTQDEADASLQEALDAGINHFDVAASYGDAEERFGPWLAGVRDRVFLSTKVEERSYDAAWASINRSLERLRVGAVDLLQLHAVGDLAELDRATGAGGSLEAALRARDEGLTRFVGITGHGHEAPATHLEALRRYPFETVMTPLNHRLAQDPAYLADHEALVAEATRQDAGIMTIKTVSRRNWPDDARPRTTWYEPLEEQRHLDAAVAWVLARPYVTGIPTPGDTRLLAGLVHAERARSRTSVEDAEAVLAGVPDYASPFVSMPW
jgi:aryl-alcohol dehydrogenase-like predicted oxidoreductase